MELVIVVHLVPPRSTKAHTAALAERQDQADDHEDYGLVDRFYRELLSIERWFHADCRYCIGAVREIVTVECKDILLRDALNLAQIVDHDVAEEYHSHSLALLEASSYNPAVISSDVGASPAAARTHLPENQHSDADVYYRLERLLHHGCILEGDAELIEAQLARGAFKFAFETPWDCIAPA